MWLKIFTNYPSPYAPGTNDYAYEKRDFTYYLTNYVGSTNAVSTMKVGCVLVAQKMNVNNVIATDWIGKSNSATTVLIPDCSQVTTNEIRAIVAGGFGGTNQIEFDPNVNLDDPNP